MKQIQWLLVFLLAAPALQAQEDFTKLPGGAIEYKIIPANRGMQVKHGNYLEFSFRQSYRDSVTASSEEYANQVVVLDTMVVPMEIYTVFSQCGLGDSVVLRVLTDSVYKSGIPPGMEKGQYIITTYRILQVYTSSAPADSAYKAQNNIARANAARKAAAQLAADTLRISRYLATEKIRAVKTKDGVYIQQLAPGRGRKATMKDALMVNYTGRTLYGRVFDSNTDPAFGHQEPYEVKLWSPEVIAGWVKALPYFSLGTRARVYIPSPLGYGQQGSGADIGPNEILVFDMEVVKITPQQPARATAPKAKPGKPAARKPKKRS